MPESEVEVIDVQTLPSGSAEKVAYDPRPHHDAAQRRIAYTLVGTLAGLIGLSFVGLGLDWLTIAELESFMSLVLGSLVGLVGAVTGFYFGGKAGNGRN